MTNSAVSDDYINKVISDGPVIAGTPMHSMALALREARDKLKLKAEQPVYDQNRHNALAYAIDCIEKGEPADGKSVVETARAFLIFLNGDQPEKPADLPEIKGEQAE